MQNKQKKLQRICAVVCTAQQSGSLTAHSVGLEWLWYIEEVKVEEFGKFRDRTKIFRPANRGEKEKKFFLAENHFYRFYSSSL